MSTKITGRTRNYATIIYTDSAPANWIDILSDMHIPALVSPLHDRDTLPDSNFKKPHYHVIIMFGTVKTRKQAEQVFNDISGVGTEAVKSLQAYARYLIHMDNPDKAQYDAADIIALSGADYNAVTHLAIDDINILRDMLAYIRTNQITNFAYFADICAANNDDWFRTLISHRNTYFVREYVKSLGWEMEQNNNINQINN